MLNAEGVSAVVIVIVVLVLGRTRLPPQRDFRRDGVLNIYPLGEYSTFILRVARSGDGGIVRARPRESDWRRDFPRRKTRPAAARRPQRDLRERGAREGEGEKVKVEAEGRKGRVSAGTYELPRPRGAPRENGASAPRIRWLYEAP